MNQRSIDLYKQAIEFAYTTIGKEHANTAYFQGVVAGKFAQLIIKECAQVARHDAVRKMSGEDIAGMIEMHFGVDE